MRALLTKVFSLALLAIVPASIKAGAAQDGAAWDHEFQSIDGKPMPLKAYQGKVLLVVNTASFCGFTPQYKALEALHEKYEKQGLVVIGVPSNDFGGQEPKAEGEIKEFCEGAFGVTFPLTSKYAVTGAGAHPFYKWVVSALGPKSAPGWNFHKYLVGRDGKVVSSFFSGSAPDSKEVVAAIEAELRKPVPNS